MVDNIQCMAVAIFLMGLFNSGLLIQSESIDGQSLGMEESSPVAHVKSPILRTIDCLMINCVKATAPLTPQKVCAMDCLSEVLGMLDPKAHGSLGVLQSRSNVRSRGVNEQAACIQAHCSGLSGDAYIDCLVEHNCRFADIKNLYRELITRRHDADKVMNMDRRGQAGQYLSKVNEPCPDCGPITNLGELLECQYMCKR